MFEQHGLTIVLGASSGVGATLLERLLGEGALAVGFSRRAESSFGRSLVVADVTDRAALVGAVGGLDGPVESVVNCVGVGFYAPWDSDGSPEWSEMAATNVAGLANVLSVVGTLDPDPENYLHVGSLAAHRPSNSPGNAVYSATKVAGRAMVNDFRNWSVSAARATRVAMLSPALINGTDFDANFFRADETARTPLYERPHLAIEEVVDVIVRMLTTPRHLEISDLVLRHRLQED